MMNTMRVRVKYEEWLTVDAENESQALRAAYDMTIDEYGREFADYAIFDLEQEVGA
jgi:hypothetical protein